ncbi:fibroin heavy chain-like [Limulus polyphemus]|uniref:Fibroin heavy chain-like n=1 Tax=Limulus polyphemus TaxID=6850 RepID=A0ABM1BPF3_LIMPO|nr:fibroin heavy chain-like [Limulus polyphemus]
MKFQVAFLLFAVVEVLTTEVKQETVPVPAVYPGPADSAAGYADYAKLNKDFGAKGHSSLADHGSYGSAAQGASGLLKDAAFRNLNAFGAKGASHGQFKDKDVYSRDRGYGYQKAYAYDKVVSFHDVDAEKGAYGSKQGLSDDSAHSKLDSNKRYGQGAFGKHDLHGASGYDRQRQLGSGYAKKGYAEGVGAIGYQPAHGDVFAPSFNGYAPVFGPGIGYGPASAFRNGQAYSYGPTSAFRNGQAYGYGPASAYRNGQAYGYGPASAYRNGQAYGYGPAFAVAPTYGYGHGAPHSYPSYH